jgi:selenocysteine-specific elongation factor
VIIGTAGHIDHGKSTLVQALTGQAMDRLADEQRRGITIDLNFAALVLDDGRRVGIIDVPGHEDFVRTMVAGATGIDLLMLVVAADEGLMPQTREHLAVAEQLGVSLGIPVITKTDLVEDDWCALVKEDVVARLESSPIDFCQPITVSSPTGTGLEELRQAVAEMAGRVPQRPGDDVFRLPVDRAFSVAGVGTVVTGTCWSGSVAVGDRVRLAPGGPAARVRSIETHGDSTAAAQSGSRVALGLVGVDREQVSRGDTVVEERIDWKPVRAIDVAIHLLPDAPQPLISRRRIRLHLGTSEVVARVYPRTVMEQGSSGLARLVCDTPVIARGGDRFILRSYSPVTTIGGGRVIDPSPPRHGASWPEGLAAEDPGAHLVALAARRPGGIGSGELPLLLGLAPAAAGQVAGTGGNLRQVAGHWVPETRIAALEERARHEIEAHHQRRPADPGMPLETLRGALGRPAWLVAAALDDLAGTGEFLLDHGIARREGFRPEVAGGGAAIDRVVAILERAELSPPAVETLGEEVGRSDIGDILRLAAAEGRVVPVERHRYYASSQLERFVAVLRELGSAGDITPAGVRDQLGLSRKFAIPLLEWADGQGITRRVGDARRLVNPQAASSG